MSEYSKTFCPYPWIHMMTHPMGTVSFCCVAANQLKTDEGFMEFDGMQTGEVFRLTHGAKMEDAWNGTHMKHIRRQMDKGEKVVGCEPCYDCLLYTSPSPRDATLSRMPSSA